MDSGRRTSAERTLERGGGSNHDHQPAQRPDSYAKAPVYGNAMPCHQRGLHYEQQHPRRKQRGVQSDDGREWPTGNRRVGAEVCAQVVGASEADNDCKRHHDRHPAVKDAVVRTSGQYDGLGQGTRGHGRGVYHTSGEYGARRARSLEPVQYESFTNAMLAFFRALIFSHTGSPQF